MLVLILIKILLKKMPRECTRQRENEFRRSAFGNSFAHYLNCLMAFARTTRAPPFARRTRARWSASAYNAFKRRGGSRGMRRVGRTDGRTDRTIQSHDKCANMAVQVVQSRCALNNCAGCDRGAQDIWSSGCVEFHQIRYV